MFCRVTSNKRRSRMREHRKFFSPFKRSWFSCFPVIASSLPLVKTLCTHTYVPMHIYIYSSTWKTGAPLWHIIGLPQEERNSKIWYYMNSSLWKDALRNSNFISFEVLRNSGIFWGLKFSVRYSVAGHPKCLFLRSARRAWVGITKVRWMLT